MLLDRGAQIDERAEYGVTPLLVASLRGHAEVLSALLARGADPSVMATVRGFRLSPLSVAPIVNSLGVIEALLQHSHRFEVRELTHCHRAALALGHEQVAALLLNAFSARNMVAAPWP